MSEKKKVNKIWLVVLIIAIVVAALCIVYFLNSCLAQKMSDEEKQKYTATTAEVTKTNANPIDFAKLKKTNSETVAWIKIDNTDIDYPVMRPSKEDDTFYLDHNYKKEYTTVGEIYMEKKNSADFVDPVTVLYGHNWINNGLFRELYKFKDPDFFKKNQYMYVYTPGHILKYEIYAAYEYDNRHILNSFDFTNTTVLNDYFQTTLNPSSLVKNIRDGVTLNQNSKTLTLSTCVEGVETARYLVQGVLVEDTITS